MNRTLGKALSVFVCLMSSQVFATVFDVPPPEKSIVGQVHYSPAQLGDTVVSIAKRFDVGFNQIENANPDKNLTYKFRPGTTVAIPARYLLPDEARQGIVINLPEMRMYYYVPGTKQVNTYPIGIGKLNKTLPVTKTVITRKTKDPVWIPTPDIREFNLKQGIVLPQVMPPGPDNPLGPYAIYMGIPTFLIHSTIFPESVGKRASFGCVRMYESDIEKFFPSIEGGIPVVIINRPVKVSWDDDRLYMEAHKPLEEAVADSNLVSVVKHIQEKTKDETVLIDWQMVSYLSEERDGLPHEIGIRIRP